MRSVCLMLILYAAAATAAPESRAVEAVPAFAASGRGFFYSCEFSKAAKAFEKAVSQQPGSANLHFWLGRSYARLAEVSSPLSASRNAGRARLHLEEAVRLDARNAEYLQELFQFYLDSPEWIHGGLKRAAALLEQSAIDEAGRAELARQIAQSKEEHSGPAWWFRSGVVWTTASAGHIVP